MALLSPIFERRAAVTAQNVSIGDPALAELFGGVNSASGQNVNSDTALRSSAVFACVSIRSQMVGMFPKHVKRLRPDGGKDILKNHRFYQTLAMRPNRWQNSFEWFAMMQAHCDLRGNAYSKITFNQGRKLNELTPLHPDRVWPIIETPDGNRYFMFDNSPCPPDGSKLYYQHFPINAATEMIEAEDIVHLRGFSINGVVGMNPITRVAREAIGLALATEEHGARLFSNGAQISKVFRHPQALSDKAYERLKGSLNSEYSGVSNAGKTMILEEGMDITSLSMTMENAQFLETRKFQVEDIARIFNVPLVLIGHGDKAPTYASAEQFFMSFKTHTMQPLVTNWEQTLTNSLLNYSDDQGAFVDMDMDSMMRADAKARSEYLKNLFGIAGISPNDGRIYEGMDPKTDEGANKLYIMSNMVPLAKAGEQPTKTPTEPVQGAEA